MSASDSGASSAESTESSRPRVTRWIVLGGAVVLLLGLAIPKLSESDDAAAGGAQENAPMGVNATVVRTSSMTDRLQSTGTLRADESVELTTETAGKVVDIRFEEGARVERGDLLVKINDAELQAEKKRLTHRLELASAQASRQERLLAEGGVSQEEYDATVNEVEVLRAELELVEAQIDKTEVRAPFGGTVGLRNVSEGSYLSQQTPITTLQRIDPIKVDLSVPEKYVGRVGTGQSITFTVRSSDRPVEGTIYAANTEVNENTRTLQLRARAANPDGLLRPGMFADVTVTLGTTDDALVVPATAVVPTLDGQRVFLAQNGTAQPRNVSLGLRTDTTVQVTGGLAVQDTVITSGIQDLRAGLPIRVEALD